MPEPLLSIRRLRVDFPEVVAVHDLDLEVCGGDVFGLIGPNGAGKTTTMRAVAGLQECTHGAIAVGGFDLSRQPRDVKRRLGFMPDFSPVYDQLTAAEFLDHFARAYGVADRARRIEECLELTSLAEKRDTLCEELSRGMKQRLVLAKTLVPDPPVLLLDEPASGLDPIARIELRELLLKLRSAGKAILISSHILTEMSGFCNKVAIMERGRLVSVGAIDELGRQVGRRRMAVKWRMDDCDARSLLARAAGVENLKEAGLGATFEFTGSAEQLDDLLRQLVVAGVRVTEWRPLDDDLEHIFLRSGARELM